jgi:magnesium transporter
VLRAWTYLPNSPRASPVDDAQLRAALEDEQMLLWIDCASPTTAELEQLSALLQLHPLAIEDMAHGEQRTKLERYPDHFHVALRDCELRDGELAASEVDMAFANGWLLTVHDASTTPVIDEAVRRFQFQRDQIGANDEGFLVWSVLDVIVDRYFLVTDAIDEQIDAVEDIVFEERVDGIPRELFAIRRALVKFRRVVGPLREVIVEFLRREVECVDDPAITHLQDVYDHVLRALDLSESQRELATGLLEAQLAIQSNQTNKVMKATSGWGAILIVATLIAGIYGMNFRHQPEFDWFWGYPMALALMVVSTISLYIVFRRRDWL